MTDIEIARNAKIKKINEIAKENGISEEYLENYGKFKAKISSDFIEDYISNHQEEMELKFQVML